MSEAKQIGRYKIISQLGEGGMAKVFKVWDNQRSVYLAMKVLRADLAEDKVFIRRFKREAETLEKLQHPHIVRFYGIEEVDIDVFMLMDYIEGTTLRQQIRKINKPFSADQILNIMRPVCAALNYAHLRNIVHCDMKPANIMIHSNGTVLVADFGISRLAEGATTVTLAGAGTPAYMSPEQITGKNPVPQTDIYALGIVLYEMLTGGERPFTGERANVTGTSGEKVRWEHMKLDPIPMRKYNSSVPANLEMIVGKCLAKDPDQRYASALDLLAALEVVLASFVPASSKVETEETGLNPLPLELQVTAAPQQPPADNPYSYAAPVLPIKKRSPSKIVVGAILGLIAVVVLGIALMNTTWSFPGKVVATLTPSATNSPTSTLTPRPLPTRTFTPTVVASPTVTPFPGARKITFDTPVSGNTAESTSLWFFFGNEGDTIFVRMAGKYANFDLLDKDSKIAANCDASSDFVCSLTGFKLPYTGIYYLVASDRGTQIKQVYNYWLNVPNNKTNILGGPFTLILSAEPITQ